jgi:hypothetical protein
MGDLGGLNSRGPLTHGGEGGQRLKLQEVSDFDSEISKFFLALICNLQGWWY